MIERIHKILDYSGLSERAFGMKCNINIQNVYEWRKGRHPNFEMLVAILNTFPELSAEWLMRGKGEMILTITEAKLWEQIDIKDKQIEYLMNKN